MRQVSGDTWGVDDIVEGEFGDERRGLEEEGQWLEGRSRQQWDVVEMVRLL